MKFVDVKYVEQEVETNGGYQCGCGGDDHDQFVEIHGCDCQCHKPSNIIFGNKL
jgi:hypothetical protein